MTFNMLVDFTIESGSVDVNFAALKNYGALNDRSYHNPEAAPGKYYNDTSVKGIETESLPRVEAELEIVIDADTPNGENMPVLIHNRFFNDGNVVPYWMTNINIVRDDYRFSKEIAVDTDMLTLAYRDDSKLSYYGPNVPAEKRDNVWLFDPFHHNTLGYESGMPWDAATHVPNAPNGNSFDIDNPPDQKWEFNLGNFRRDKPLLLNGFKHRQQKADTQLCFRYIADKQYCHCARRIWANAQPIYAYAHGPVCAL